MESKSSLEIKKPAAPASERFRALLPDILDLVRPRRGILLISLVLMVINRISGLALPDQGFATLQAQRIEFGRQPRPLVRRQVVEDLDRIEAVLGGVL